MKICVERGGWLRSLTSYMAQPKSAVMDGRKVARVHKSQDRYWPKYAVVYPDRETKWFDSESQALIACDDYNGTDNGMGVIS